MASTNKTPRLGLNQWAAGDPVLREDFNGDNLKIDGAMGAAREENCVVKLLDETTTADAPQADFDISGIPWKKYRKLIMRLTVMGDNDAKTELYINKIFTNTYTCNSGTCTGGMLGMGKTTRLCYGRAAGTSSYGVFNIEFYVDPKALLWGKWTTYEMFGSTSDMREGYCFHTTVHYPELTSFNVKNETGPVKAGTHMTLWGVKA